MVHGITTNYGRNDIHVDNTFVESYHVVRTVYNNLVNLTAISDKLVVINTLENNLALLNSINNQLPTLQNTVNSLDQSIDAITDNEALSVSELQKIYNNVTGSNAYLNQTSLLKQDVDASKAYVITKYNEIVNLLLTYGNKYYYDTLALANADIANIPANSIVEIFADENNNGIHSIYKKESNLLVFKLSELIIDKTFIPSSQVSATNFGATYLREFVEHKLHLNMLNPTLDGVVNVGTRLQALLTAAGASTRIGSREVVISGKGTSKLALINSALIVPSGIRIVCDDETALLPGSEGMAMFALYSVSPNEGLISGPTLESSDYSNPLHDPNDLQEPNPESPIFKLLSASSYKNSDRVTLSDASSFSVGDFVMIKNSKIIDTSPNIFKHRQMQPMIITRKEGNTLIFQDPLVYDFPTDVGYESRIGKFTNVKRNNVFENLNIGQMGQAIKGGRGIDTRHPVNLRVLNTKVENTRISEIADNTGRSAINISGGYKPYLKNITTNYIIGYGYTVNGACYQAVLEDFNDYMSRHGFSYNWSGPGEPINCSIIRATISNSTLSGGDWHDVGIGSYVQDLRVIGARDAGVQMRTSNIHLHNVYVEGSTSFGIRTNSPTPSNSWYFEKANLLNNYKITGKCEIRNNKRGGLTVVGDIVIDDIISHDNGYGSEVGGPYFGINILKGHIKKANVQNNNGNAFFIGNNTAFNNTMGKIIIENLYAPANENQVTLFSLGNVSGNNYTYANIELKNSLDISGYTLNKHFVPRVSNPRDENLITQIGNKFGSDALFGSFQLNQGIAYVPNNNIFSSTPKIEPINFIEGILNKSLSGVALGTGTVNLPSTWKQSGTGLGGLVFEVVGFNRDVLEPYVDIRVSGTGTSPQFNLYFMDTVSFTNRPLTVQNDSWLLKVKLALLAGSMTNVTNSFYVVEYDDIPTINTSVLSSSFGSSVVITNTETEFIRTYVITNANTTSFLYGLRFNTTVSVPIDFTIRIKNPSAILGSPTSTIQSVILSELRPLKGFVATSYNVDGSINTSDNRKCNYTI